MSMQNTNIFSYKIIMNIYFILVIFMDFFFFFKIIIKYFYIQYQPLRWINLHLYMFNIEN